MKNILVLAHDDDGQEARIQTALDLGRALNGHLTCLDLVYVSPVGGSGFPEDAYVVAELVTLEATRERANKDRLEARLAHEDVPWDWIEGLGDPAHCIARAAALADIIVVNRQLEHISVINMRRTTSELIVKSGKPVMAIPADCKRLDLSAVLVAWDGSPSAAAALRAAVPLLKLAERVVLLEVQDGSIAAPVEDAASYLSRHDIHATIRRVAVGPDGAGGKLMAEASTGGFGYVVMGGYGHLRFVEALFGGVTRAMLTDCPIPVFLAH